MDGIEQWFQQNDLERKGGLTTIQLQMALKNNNYTNFNIKVAELMVDMFDKDNSGLIRLDEFRQLWGFLSQWRTFFDKYDRDRNGSISYPEFTQVLPEMGLR